MKETVLVATEYFSSAKKAPDLGLIHKAVTTWLAKELTMDAHGGFYQRRHLK